MVRTEDGSVGRGLGAWQIAARWSRGDLVDSDIQGGIGESLTLGFNWFWSANARMQFNYLTGDIKNNGGVSGKYDILGMRLMVDF